MSKTKKVVPIKKSALSKEQLLAILKRLEAGQTLVIEESKKLGYKHNPQLRKALTELLGSKAKYNAMLLRAVKARGGKKENGKKQPLKKAA
jgi:16S rRNA G1207 methylase RsmC